MLLLAFRGLFTGTGGTEGMSVSQVHNGAAFCLSVGSCRACNIILCASKQDPCRLVSSKWLRYIGWGPSSLR